MPLQKYGRNAVKTGKQQGFTLIELMVTVVIIGILSAIAYPSYIEYIVRANRSAAQSYMMGLANQQAQFLIDARRYFCTDAAGCDNVLTDATTPAFIVPVDVSNNYEVVVTAEDDGLPTFTITATPVGAQLARDTKCATLTLDQTGKKDIDGGTGTASKCW